MNLTLGGTENPLDAVKCALFHKNVIRLSFLSWNRISRCELVGNIQSREIPKEIWTILPVGCPCWCLETWNELNEENRISICINFDYEKNFNLHDGWNLIIASDISSLSVAFKLCFVFAGVF